MLQLPCSYSEKQNNQNESKVHEKKNHLRLFDLQIQSKWIFLSDTVAALSTRRHGYTPRFHQ